MLGLSSNPISAIPPLNAFSTLHSPSVCIWSLVRPQLFTNCSFSSVTNCTCTCSSSRAPTTTPPTRRSPVEVGAAFRPNATTKTTITTTTTTKTANHAVHPLLLLRRTIGRIAYACIEKTTAVQAKAKGAVRAISCWSCACTTSHFFVRVPTHLAANLIALLRDPTLVIRAIRRHLFSSHTRSSSSSTTSSLYSLPQRPVQSPLSLLLVSPPLLLKEALATSQSLAQALLQTPRRQDPFSTVPPRRLPHLSAARLWNPTNSTPRLPDKPVRKRRPSTPPPPAVPLSHPTLDPSSVDPADPLGIGAGDYPLLTLPEQRQTRHSTSNRTSLQVDRSGNAEHRISLPPSFRHSYDGRRSADPSPTFPDLDSGPADDKEGASAEPPVESQLTGLWNHGQSASSPLIRDFAITLNTDKGKGKAVMEQRTESQGRGASKDLERGPDVLPRPSNVSAGDGIGSAISSSNSSIMGEELPPDLGEEWGPQHPCFPHLNPHVPLDSPEYQNTRIIRVRRDWLIEGDLAPTFSNLYPEILDPAGLSEQEFRRVIDKLNGELIPIFSPYNWRNVVDGLLGLVTGWLWDDLGFTGVKARLKRLERWIDQWNTEMEKTVGNEDSSMAPRIISLRKTGYMTLDIQIPDPEIAPAPSTPGGSRSGSMPMEPPTAVKA
ncbi:putative conserved hypothetical protein [Colletotrichum tofieldiae]|nr:putative conserved hypothetical protein [Colletotrichum tofieldiae]